MDTEQNEIRSLQKNDACALLTWRRILLKRLRLPTLPPPARHEHGCVGIGGATYTVCRQQRARIGNWVPATTTRGAPRSSTPGEQHSMHRSALRRIHRPWLQHGSGLALQVTHTLIRSFIPGLSPRAERFAVVVQVRLGAAQVDDLWTPVPLQFWNQKRARWVSIMPGFTSKRTGPNAHGCGTGGGSGGHRPALHSHPSPVSCTPCSSRHPTRRSRRRRRTAPRRSRSCTRRRRAPAWRGAQGCRTPRTCRRLQRERRRRAKCQWRVLGWRHPAFSGWSNGGASAASGELTFFAEAADSCRGRVSEGEPVSALFSTGTRARGGRTVGLTYARLLPAHDQVGVMLRHAGYAGL